MPNVMKALGQTSATAVAANSNLNLIKDPSFEAFASGTNNATTTGNQWNQVSTSRWWQYSTIGGANVGYTNAQSVDGSNSIQLSTVSGGSPREYYAGTGMSTTGGSPNASTGIPVTAGTTYYGGFSVRVTEAVYYNSQQPQMRVQWFNSSFGYISESTIATAGLAAINTWGRATGSAVAPAGAVWATVYLRLYHGVNVSGGNVAFFDAVHFGDVSSMNTTWVNGSAGTNATLTAPFTTRLSSSWTGTVNDSTTATTYAGAPVAIYTVPSGKQAVVSTLHVANLSTSAQTYRIAHVPSGETLAKKHWIAFDISVAANSNDSWTTGIALNSGDILYVASDSADVSFTAHGTEITP